VDKPVLNVFRMAGMMRGDRVQVSGSAALPADAIIRNGVRANPDIDALAVASGGEISVMAWSYHDDDVPAGPSKVTVEIRHVTGKRLLLSHYRIDETHSNAWTAWKKMGSPQNPTPAQFAELEAAGQLQLLDSPHYVNANNGTVKIDLTLPRQSISLLQLR